MRNCKKIPIPRLEGVDVNKLMLFYKMGNKFFLSRYNVNAWKSFDLILTVGKLEPSESPEKTSLAACSEF